jgi:hypothetical protein
MLTQSAARKALKKRQALQPKPIELDPNFPKQNSFVLDASRYIDAQCSRRAGKTNGLALRFFNTLQKYPNSQCLYLALTYESAIDIMMPVLKELNDKYSLGCTFTEGVMKHPNGAKLKVMGADMKNFIKRIKGRKFPGVAIDESQDFGTHLQSLIDDVLTPCIADYADGWLAVTGTPGPVPQGYFFNVTQERKYGYSHHEWTLLENPYMPNPAAFIEDLKKKREWDDNHPTLLREWRNKWVLDVESLWIRYKESVNHYQALPLRSTAYNYIMGIDLGFKDADAIAILAWHEDDPKTYLVEECITRKQGITELVAQVEALEKKYKVSKMVIDEGGLGKKIAEELRRQKGLPVEMADKARKQENVEFLNDALRRGLFMAKGASQFAQDSYLVQIDWDKSTPDKIVIKKKPHSDIIDAVLYAFKESPSFAYEAPKPKPHPGTKEWADSQVDEMWEAAQQHFASDSDRLPGID